jgi:hypothetical protein
MFATRDLAVYGATIGTVGGLWTLYAGVVLDRARIRVRVTEAHSIKPGSKVKTPLLVVSVSNRGRRGASIQSVSRVVSMRRAPGSHEISADIAQQLAQAVRLGEGEGRTFLHGELGGYTLGAIPLRRWFVLDGADRMHPLRERWRQRVERAIWRLP